MVTYAMHNDTEISRCPVSHETCGGGLRNGVYDVTRHSLRAAAIIFSVPLILSRHGVTGNLLDKHIMSSYSSIMITVDLTYFTFVYRLGVRGKKETFVCCTPECLGRRDVVQR